MHDGRHLWRLEWSVFHSAAAELAAAASANRPDLVLAVARGGVPLGHRVANWLSTRLLVVVARGNETDAIQSAPVRVPTLDVDRLQACGEARRIMVCDDIAGSGATLRAVHTALQIAAPAASVLTATLCCNVGAEPRPDMWVWTVRDWVLFPWERETEAWEHALPLRANDSVQRNPTP